MKTTTKRQAKWLEAMDAAHYSLHLAKMAEAAGDKEQARRCAEVAHQYHLDARRYED